MAQISITDGAISLSDTIPANEPCFILRRRPKNHFCSAFHHAEGINNSEKSELTDETARLLPHMRSGFFFAGEKAGNQEKGSGGADGGVSDIEGRPVAIPREDDIEKIDDIAVEDTIGEVSKNAGD